MRKSINVRGLDCEWDEENGVLYMVGQRVMAAWTGSTLAGLLLGFQRMVGTDRFLLALHAGGRDGVDGDWGVISSFPTFLEGFQALTDVAKLAGWGRWEIISIDDIAKTAIVRVYHSWESGCYSALGVDWGSYYVAGKLAGIFERYFKGERYWAEQTSFIARGDEYDEFSIRPSEHSVEDLMDRLLVSNQSTNADLAVALERVRKEVEVRDQTERELREKLELIAHQEEAIRALSTPIIEVWDGILTLPLFGTVDSRRAGEMMERLLATIVQKSATYAIIDLTGVEVVDTSTADHIGKLVNAVELLGGRCIITGIRPAVAQTMVQIGIDLTRIVTLSTMREALRRCMREQDRERKAIK